VTESFWLVISPGIVAVVAGLVPLILQRHWQAKDRRRAIDAKALEAAVAKLMAWHSYANKALSGETSSADERLLAEVDASWDADFKLIPIRKLHASSSTLTARSTSSTAHSVMLLTRWNATPGSSRCRTA
jgi:hypothetical protein